MSSNLCTPEYNEATRKMMRDRDELRRIADGAKEGDFGTAIRAKAKELIADGKADASNVAAQVRDWINKYAPHTEREVRDAISGYGRERTETKDVLQQRINAINAELRDMSRREDIASGKVDPNAAKDKARQTALRREMAELQERIRTGDYDTPERTPPQYSKETIKLQGQVAAVRREINRLIEAREAKNRTSLRKTADFLIAAHRAAILSGYHVLGKLASYSGTELLAAPMNSIVSEAWRHVPGIKQVYEKAPRHGAGFVPEAELTALKALVDPETWRRAGNQIKKGYDNFDAQFGDKMDHPALYPYLEVFGRIHAAEKTPIKAMEEARSRVLYQAQRIAELKKANPKASDAEIMDMVMQPEEQSAIAAKAYQKGQEAILQNDNAIVNAWKGAISILKGKEGDATSRLRKALAYFLEYHIPIVRVPANLLDRLSSYTPVVGHLKAASVLKGLDKMTEAEAEYFAKNLNASTIGTAAALIGWYGYKNISGYYQQGDAKKGRDAETATINGHTIPRAAFHHPASAVMQLWATVHRVYDEKRGGAGGAVSGALAGARGAIEQLPFLDYITRQGTNFKDATSLSNYAGREVSELEPQFLKDLAKDIDPAKSRKAKGFTDQLKAGVPGLRETLPQR